MTPRIKESAAVSAYIAKLPAERAATIRAACALVRKYIPAGYDEMTSFGMINWGISLERYPETYNGQPICYVALAAQKGHTALYLMSAYGSPKITAELKAAFKRAGKKFDMGKSCLRFQAIDDLVPEAVGKAIAAMRPEEWQAMYESVHAPKAKRATSGATTKRARSAAAMRRKGG